MDAAFLARFAPRAVILSGGPASVTEADTPRADPALLTAGFPVLGICHGQQTMVEQLGGRVEPGATCEFGRALVEVTDCALLDGVWEKGGRETVWMSHGDRVTALPPGFRSMAVSEGAPFAVIADNTRRASTACVPSGGGAHAACGGAAAPFHAPRCWLPRRLGNGGVP